jgi:hypothetical protein
LIDVRSKKSYFDGTFAILSVKDVNVFDSSDPDSWRDNEGLPASLIRPLVLQDNQKEEPGHIRVNLEAPSHRNEDQAQFQLHRLVHMVAHHYGITIFADGMLERVGVKLPPDTTYDQYITYKPRKSRRASVDKFLREDDNLRSKRCDVDHRLGKDRRYLHGLLYSQPISHRMNICFRYVREDAGDWCFGLHIGAYNGGVESPTAIDDTYVPSVVGNEVLFNEEQIDETNPFHENFLTVDRHDFLRGIYDS